MNTNKTKHQQEDKEMILNPDSWPSWPFLPVKSTTKKELSGWPLLGTILSYDVTKVKLVNMYDYSKNADIISYDSVDDLLADGWVID